MALRLRVKELREPTGMSQDELATKAGIRRATVTAIENNRTTRIDFDTLERLARVLKVEPGFLIVRK